MVLRDNLKPATKQVLRHAAITFTTVADAPRVIEELDQAAANGWMPVAYMSVDGGCVIILNGVKEEPAGAAGST